MHFVSLKTVNSYLELSVLPIFIYLFAAFKSMTQSPYHLPPPPDESSGRSSRAASPYANLTKELIDLSPAYDVPVNKHQEVLQEFDPLVSDNRREGSVHKTGQISNSDESSDEGKNKSWRPIRTDSPQASLYSGLVASLINIEHKYNTLRRVPNADRDSPVASSPQMLCELPMEASSFSPEMALPPPSPPAASPVEPPVPQMRRKTKPRSDGVDGISQLPLFQDSFSLDELASLNTNRLSRCQYTSSSLYPSLSRPGVELASDGDDSRPHSSASLHPPSNNLTAPSNSGTGSPAPSNSSAVSGAAGNVLDHLGNVEYRELCTDIANLRVAIDNEGEDANPGVVHNAILTQPFPLPTSIVVAYRFGNFLNERAPASSGSSIATGSSNRFVRLLINMSGSKCILDVKEIFYLLF